MFSARTLRAHAREKLSQNAFSSTQLCFSLDSRDYVATTCPIACCCIISNVVCCLTAVVAAVNLAAHFIFQGKIMCIFNYVNKTKKNYNNNNSSNCMKRNSTGASGARRTEREREEQRQATQIISVRCTRR